MGVDTPIVEHLEEVHLAARPFYCAVVIFNVLLSWLSAWFVALVLVRPFPVPLALVFLGSIPIVLVATILRLRVCGVRGRAADDLIVQRFWSRSSVRSADITRVSERLVWFSAGHVTVPTLHHGSSREIKVTTSLERHDDLVRIRRFALWARTMHNDRRS